MLYKRELKMQAYGSLGKPGEGNKRENYQSIIVSHNGRVILTLVFKLSVNNFNSHPPSITTNVENISKLFELITITDFSLEGI